MRPSMSLKETANSCSSIGTSSGFSGDASHRLALDRDAGQVGPWSFEDCTSLFVKYAIGDTVVSNRNGGELATQLIFFASHDALRQLPHHRTCNSP